MFILFPHSALENDALREVVDKQGYQIVMTEAELNGPERFAADNVISDDMCRELIDLALVSRTLLWRNQPCTLHIRNILGAVILLVWVTAHHQSVACCFRRAPLITTATITRGRCSRRTLSMRRSAG